MSVCASVCLFCLWAWGWSVLSVELVGGDLGWFRYCKGLGVAESGGDIYWLDLSFVGWEFRRWK